MDSSRESAAYPVTIKPMVSVLTCLKFWPTNAPTITARKGCAEDRGQDVGGWSACLVPATTNAHETTKLVRKVPARDTVAVAIDSGRKPAFGSAVALYGRPSES